MLTADDRAQIRSKARAAIDQATLRNDAWWAQGYGSIAVLGVFVLYSTYAAVVGSHYFVEPYISPLYAPCIAANCAHQTFHVIGTFWRWSPALLIILFPLGFRTTCYFYRRVTYRGLFRSPAACAVNESTVNPLPKALEKGESRFPFSIMNIHRYFFMVAFVLAVLHWYDFALAFHVGGGQGGWGIGLGTVLMGIDSTLLSLYVLSCHAGRHLIGGRVNTFSKSPIRYRLWKLSTRFNPRHGPIAWASLVAVVMVDLYVRGLAYGFFSDPHVVLFR